jgi:hypothetical protein
VLGILTQWMLGFLHHRRYMQTQQPLKWAILPHKYGLGALLWSLALVNASLGCSLALASQRNHVLLPVVLVVAVALFATAWFKPWILRNCGCGGGARRAFSRPVIGPPLATGPQEFGTVPAGPLPPPGPIGAGINGRAGIYANDYATRSDIALGSVQPTKPREFA